MSLKRSASSHEARWNVELEETSETEVTTPAKHRKVISKVKAAKLPSQPRQRAIVVSLAIDVLTASEANVSTSTVDDRILQRIRKCFERGNHVATPEAEAKAALRMGSKLMSQYNVSQAEAFEQSEEKQVQQGGESKVRIVKANGGTGKIINHGFTGDLANAIKVFFDCQFYSAAGPSSIEYTFYGIAGNTAAAAMAFEMTYNLVCTWSMSRVGVSAKYSYCKGVAIGLYRLAEKEKNEEKRKAKAEEAEALARQMKEEMAQRQNEIDRLNAGVLDIPESKGGHTGDFSEEESSRHISSAIDDELDSQRVSPNRKEIKWEFSDDSGSEYEAQADFDEDGEATVDPLADFEDEMQKACVKAWQTSKSIAIDRGSEIKSEEKVAEKMQFKESPEEEFGANAWKSEMQLMKFRASAQTIAEDYLEAQGVKFSTRRKRPKTEIRDWDAYTEGKQDSAKIDVRSRRLE